METTKGTTANKKKGGNSLLIGLLIVLLVGGGLGAYLLMKSTAKDQTQPKEGGGEKEPVTGRKDYSDKLGEG